MYNRRRARILLAVLVLVALLLVTVDFRSDGAQGEGPLGQLRGVASAVFGPVQEGLTTILSPLSDSVGAVGGLFDARAENARLRAQLEALQERRLSYDAVLRENEELRRLLEIQERSSLDTAAAQVIATGPSNFEWTVTLDIGSEAGVARDMPVINGDGLVGRIIQTTADTSRVLLAVDPSFQAASAHAETGETGLIQGNGGEPMVFRPEDPEAEIAEGDEIITSQYSNGVFPADIPIGTVSSADEGAGLLDRTVRVRPWVDFTRLQGVLVVLYAPDRDLPDDSIGEDLPFERPEVPPTPSEEPDSETSEPFDPFATETPSATDEPTEGDTAGSE